MDILISDDSPVTLKFLQKVLENWGHNVTVCTDGAEAWQKIQDENAPKLCVIDWDMPAMSGIEVCKKARAANLDRYIIFLTAKDDALDIEEGVEVGADDYICKPFRQEELDIRIRAGMRILNLEKKLNIPHNKAILDKMD
tara:strand:+ start:33890 stop:34309 length:420 start_codon:yes stop_codon:yes gene_type:complete